MEWKSKKQFKYELAAETRKNVKLEQRLKDLEQELKTVKNTSTALSVEGNFKIGELQRENLLFKIEKERIEKSRDEWIEIFYEEKDKLNKYYTEELKVKDRKNDLLEEDLQKAKKKYIDITLERNTWKRNFHEERQRRTNLEDDMEKMKRELEWEKRGNYKKKCRVEALEMIRDKQRQKFEEIKLKNNCSIRSLRQARKKEQARTEEDKKHLKEEIIGLKLQLRRKEHLLEVRKGVMGILERSNEELSKALETTRKKNKNLNNLFLKEIVGVELEKELKKRAWTSIAYVRD